MPFFSIIIPVYNVELYLRECLESIAVSDLDCWEAILVDDGSPDGCPQICDEYAAKDRRFRVIHQKNAGVAAARNAGLDVAQGEWIWFVDSDDVVDMAHVGDIIEWLKEHKDVDLVMFDLETFKENETLSLRNSQFSIPYDHSTKNEFLMKHVCFHHPRLWYKQSIINKPSSPILFTSSIKVAEDLEFQYKYLTLCQQPIKFNNVFYHYRVRETSVTQDEDYRMKAVKDLPIVLMNLAEWIRKYKIKPESWLNFRIMKLMQNLLYSASQVSDIEYCSFQEQFRTLLLAYRSLHFPFTYHLKYRIAEYHAKTYFCLNRLYLRIKNKN